MRTPGELTELFRSRGLKVTPQRACIFQLLHENEVHPTAESIYARARVQMPTMSLKTVYQTLNDLVDMGEIRSVEVGTGCSRFDPNVEAHHHLVCSSCGKVRDLYADFSAVDIPSEALQGFQVGMAEVVFRGLCDECVQGSEDSPTHHSDEAISLNQ